MDRHLWGVPITKENIQEFVDVDKKSQCWNWRFAVDREGRAQRGSNGKVTTVSRVVFELYNGVFAQTLNILHTCDNPPCINPEHLWKGTQTDNILDSIRKGRYNRYVAVSAEEGRKIKLSYSNGLSVKQITIMYGIGRSTVYNIINNKHYYSRHKDNE